MDVLGEYLLSIRRILHDANADIWSDFDLISYCNEARNHVAADTGVLRSLISVTLTPGTEFYPWGAVTGLSISAPGSGYTSASLAFSTGSGASATASVANGSVNSVTVTSGGSAFLAPPLVTFSGGGGTLASAHSVLSGGSVGGITLDYGGIKYTSAPTVTLTPIGSGAAGTASVSNGALSSVTRTSGGSGYLLAPAVTVIGSGSGAAVTATVIPSNTIDVVNCTLVWNSLRTNLQGLPFSELSAYLRQWTQWQSYPAAFSIYGKGLYIAPVPSVALSLELDTVTLPSPLTVDNPTGVLTLPETEAVKYWAAYLARVSTGQMDQAQTLLALYNQSITWSNGIYVRRNQSLYGANLNVF